MGKAQKNKEKSKTNQAGRWGKFTAFVIVLTLLIAFYLRPTKEPPKPSPIVTVSEGKLQGIVSYSRNGNEVHEYLSVPYAKKPIGDLRFESPQPADRWEGVLEAKTITPKCMQIDIITQQKYGQEDCLYLNVYVPKVVDSKSPLPVMVYIHGGIFMYGGADLFGPKYYADENVILVTISYRLASFGFLNTGDGLVRGNMGLKDQVMSLKWIQRNINSFGGDPNKVTIFGESAGASSVHLHMLSSMSKGLFHRAISQSGTAICPFVLSRHPVEQSKRLGRQLGCPTESSKELVECLRKIDAEKIVEVHKETTDLLHESISVFSATVETVKDSDAFLTADPMDLLKEGKIVSKVPWINGVNSEEGLILAAVIAQNETILNGLENDWNRVVPKFFFYERNDTVSKLARKKYFGKIKKIGKPDNINKFTLMISDRSFFWAASESGLLHSKVSPVYMYFYSHTSDFSLAHFVTLFRRRFHYIVEVLADMALAWVNKHILGRRHHNYGCCHADEQFVMFNTPFSTDLAPQHGELYKMSRDVVKLWADFAKKGGDLSFRGVSWPKIDPSKTPLKYLLIDMSYGIIDEPFESRIQFWRENPVV